VSLHIESSERIMSPSSRLAKASRFALLAVALAKDPTWARQFLPATFPATLKSSSLLGLTVAQKWELR
jgi:hypothetical protein